MNEVVLPANFGIYEPHQCASHPFTIRDDCEMQGWIELCIILKPSLDEAMNVLLKPIEA